MLVLATIQLKLWAGRRAQCIKPKGRIPAQWPTP